MTLSKALLMVGNQYGLQQLRNLKEWSISKSHGETSLISMTCTPSENEAFKKVTLNEEKLQGSTNQNLGNWPRIYFRHLRTLWLFTRSDLKSMIYPNIIFSLACRVSKADLVPDHNGSLVNIFSRVPYVLIWLWLNLLLFNIANQRLPSSIIEDRINKPWRPIPSGYIDANQARILFLATIPVVLLVSIALGTVMPALALMALTWAYNDLGGADKSIITRNLLNAFGMSIYASGAVIIASGSHSGLTITATKWVTFIGFVIATTIHVQDMKDQEGDAARKRKTLPLVMGDGFARWTIAGAIMGWSVAAPTFWKLDIEGYIPTAAAGAIITFRILWLRSVEADRTTWAYWCVWMVSLYLLPLGPLFSRWIGR